MKVASGGELARFLLALKVVLATAARRRLWCSMKLTPA
jgi:DNA repair ATPase RecN